MRFSLAFILSCLTLIVGLAFQKPLLWLPFTFVAASVIETTTRRWVASDRLGSATSLSVILKFALALIGMWALFSLWIGNPALLVYWFLV